MPDYTLIVQIAVVGGVLIAIVGYFARRAYRADSVRIANTLGLRIGFFGGIVGTYNDCEVKIEPGTPIKIIVHYRPPFVSHEFTNINLWLLRKGLDLPWDAPTTDADPEPLTSEKLTVLDNIFDQAFDVWCRPAEFGQQALGRAQKLGSRLAKSNLQHIEVNWLFPGLSCLTNLKTRGANVEQVQRNVDLVTELARHIEAEAILFLKTNPAGVTTGKLGLPDDPSP